MESPRGGGGPAFGGSPVVEGASSCAAGTVCACATDFGIDSSCSGAGSFCVKLCHIDADCAAGKTCSLVRAGSPYKGCSL